MHHHCQSTCLCSDVSTAMPCVVRRPTRPQSANTFVTRCPIVTDIVHSHLCSSNTRRGRVNSSSTYTMLVCPVYSSWAFLTSVFLSKQLECTTNTPAPTLCIHMLQCQQNDFDTRASSTVCRCHRRRLLL